MLLYYTSATQIAGLLPSSTPAGTGTIVVTYNGTPGPPGPITVVQNNLGVYTVSQNGAGPGIVTFADYSLVSGTKAANPGETLIIWATGLGPVSGNEAAGALPGDMPDIPVKVWVGGVAATVVYRGRSGCCVGEDQIAFVVPAGVVDCNASLVIQINNQISNNSTMAIAASGRTCIPALAGESVEILNKSPLSLGFIGVFRESFPATPGGPATKSDGADGNFLKASATGAQISATLGTVPLGSCQVTTSTFTPGSQGSHKDEPGFSFSLLDAGAALTLTGPSGTRTLSKSKDGGFRGQLGDGSPGNFLDPGNYTLTGPGGSDVGKFTASITLPQPLVWTNQASLATVTRANGVTVNWTGDPKGTVEINGDSSFITGGGTGIGVNAAFKCLALAASGTFTVPAYVLLSLPPQFGNLTLGGIAPSASFTATGLDAGLFSAGSSNTISVTYR